MKTKKKKSNGIDDLIEIMKGRVKNIAHRSLQRFEQSYRKHPGMKDSPLPFLAQNIKEAEQAPEELDKIVYILGAGTSKSAGVLLASEIITHCEKATGRSKLEKVVKYIRKQMFDKQKNFLKKNESEKADLLECPKGGKNYSFEEVLTAYKTIFSEEELIQFMQNQFLVKESDFPQKTLITLFNECLAHLSREQLVDFIVTFNFDELLEHSLDEDIGPQSYVKITSPARFQWAETHGLIDSPAHLYANPDQRATESGCEIAKPWLLKPHGTITQQNTLRHLIEHVWQFEGPTERVLNDVLKNSYLVIVGYSLSSEDLHKILINHAVSGSIKKIFLVDPVGLYSRRNISELRNKLIKVMGESFIHIREDADGFALQLFKKLYSERYSEDLEGYGLHIPYRHLLRAFIFQKSGQKAQNMNIPCTFKNRYIAELACHCIRMKGWFSSRTINKCHQINHLLDNATRKQKDTLYNQPELLAPFFQSFPRKNRAERIYILKRKFEEPQEVDIHDGTFREMLHMCVPKSMKHENKGKNSFFHSDWGEEAERMGEKLQTSKVVSLYSIEEDIATFRKVLIIPNKPTLDALSKWLQSKEKGLYVVSEAGAWLGNVLVENIEKFKGVALGDYIQEKKSLEEAIKEAKIQNEKMLYLQEINRAAKRVKKIKAIPCNKIHLIIPHRKRVHFTLWEDDENNKVSGIIYRRSDRQSGTTFYWIELSTEDTIEKMQFEALKYYMKYH